MKMQTVLARVACLAALAVLAYTASSRIVSGMAGGAQQIPAPASEGLAPGVGPAASSPLASPPRGVCAVRVEQAEAVVHGGLLAISGAARMENMTTEGHTLAWSVRVYGADEYREAIREGRTRNGSLPAYFEQTYPRQPMDLAPGLVARPTFADVLTIPDLPPGRYLAFVGLDDAATGLPKAGRGIRFEVE